MRREVTKKASCVAVNQLLSFGCELSGLETHTLTGIRRKTAAKQQKLKLSKNSKRLTFLLQGDE